MSACASTSQWLHFWQSRDNLIEDYRLSLGKKRCLLLREWEGKMKIKIRDTLHNLFWLSLSITVFSGIRNRSYLQRNKGPALGTWSFGPNSSQLLCQLLKRIRIPTHLFWTSEYYPIRPCLFGGWFVHLSNGFFPTSVCSQCHLFFLSVRLSLCLLYLSE